MKTIMTRAVVYGREPAEVWVVLSVPRDLAQDVLTLYELVYTRGYHYDIVHVTLALDDNVKVGILEDSDAGCYGDWVPAHQNLALRELFSYCHRLHICSGGDFVVRGYIGEFVLWQTIPQPISVLTGGKEK